MIQVRQPETDPEGRARFREGALVRHRRYGYRGVVVALDPECQADEAWYRKNQTQPSRAQPWYHVLVHRSATATYAAEENLEPDLELSPIEHPLVPAFFLTFAAGGYVRNDRPWDGWR